MQALKKMRRNRKIARSQREELAHGKVHEEGGLACAKVRSSLRKPPVTEHLPPKPESIYFTVSCSHLHLGLYGGGGVPHWFFQRRSKRAAPSQ